MRKHKLLTSGISLFILSIISWWIQSTYYGYMDAEGIIHDSIFLPLGFIFMFLSLAVLAGWAIRAAWKFFKAGSAAA